MQSLLALFLCLSISLGIATSEKATSYNGTLRLYFAVFRHGDRTPDSGVYPNDEYKNQTWHPYGWGQITNSGKSKMFALGTSLRQRYMSFHGEEYTTDTVKATCSSFARAKTSLLSVLAGLFPPKKRNVWGAGELPQLWQPIPYDYLPIDDDPVLLGLGCPSYLSSYDTYTVTDQYKAMLKKHKQLFKFLEEHTGITPMNDIKQIIPLYYHFESLVYLKKALPHWASDIYPKKMSDCLSDAYKASCGTDKLKKFASGFLLKQIWDEIQNKMKGKLTKGRKVYLYSGHSVNVAHLLISLGIYKPHSPRLGSCVIFEVHEVDKAYGIKILYKPRENADPVAMKIPGCGTLCPIEKFQIHITNFLPGPFDKCGV